MHQILLNIFSGIMIFANVRSYLSDKEVIQAGKFDNKNAEEQRYSWYVI